MGVSFLNMINPFQKYTYAIKVTDENVYDGDTLTDVVLDLGLRITSIVDLRLARINTPEIRTKDATEKIAGLKSRDALREILRDRNDVVVHILKYEKYGRCLAELFVGDMNCSDYLLENGFAKPYNL